MFEFFVLALLAGLLGFATVRFARRRTTKSAPPRRRSPLDGWIEEQVSVASSKKLRLSRDAVIQTLRGTPDPDAVSSLEQGIRRVQLVYERLAAPHEVDLRVEIAYEGGGQDTATRRLHWDEVPEDLRADFDRTGAAHVFRAWHFPWSRGED